MNTNTIILTAFISILIASLVCWLVDGLANWLRNTKPRLPPPQQACERKHFRFNVGSDVK